MFQQTYLINPLDNHYETCEAANEEDYYDLKKTLPRFYRLFEHLNKGHLVVKMLAMVATMASEDWVNQCKS